VSAIWRGRLDGCLLDGGDGKRGCAL